MKRFELKKYFPNNEWNFLFIFIRFWSFAFLALSVGTQSEIFALENSPATSTNQLNTGATPVLTAVTPSSSQSTRRFALSSSLGFSTNLAEINSIDQSSNLDLEISPQYTINSKQSLIASFSISKELQGEETLSILNDAALIFSQKGPSLSKSIGSSVSIQEIIPLSKDSRERDSLLSSLTLKPGISMKTKFGSLSYKIGITRHLHKFQSTSYGKSNMQWGISNSLGFSSELIEGLSLSVSLSHNNAWTYLGSLSQSFTGIEELNYELNAKTSLSFGHRNVGSVLKADGVTSNIAIFNSNSSIIYSGFSYNF